MTELNNHRFLNSYDVVGRAHGTNKGDVWPGTVGNDQYFGRGGADTISGFKGNDRLHGGGGIDILDGEEGNDRLFGDAGNDFLTGGYGDDIMTGGAGKDSFYLLTDYSIGIHTDKITDFVAKGKDHELVQFIDGLHFQFDTLADVRHHMKQHGDDVKFNFGTNNYVIFEHAHIGDFSMQDFQF